MLVTRMKCERCHRQYRQVLHLGRDYIVQDWHARIGHPTVSVAEFDTDICEDCEAEVFAACKKAGLE